MTKHEFYRDIDNYVLINNDYYRREYTNPHQLNPIPVNATHLKGRFGFTARQLEEVIELSGFINEPMHVDYLPIINDKWNQYHRVGWKPVQGKWPTIEKLINHIYGDNGVERDQRDEIYDYHTIMLKSPKQKLFARVLYSHVQGTSKSTMAELEHMMFEDNYAKVRDNEFEDKFNSLWSDAILVHMDEPQFKDAKGMSRWIRDLVTTQTVNVRKMKQEYVKKEFHAKFLITSNDSDFMPFEQSDRRYWIREVPKFPATDMDANFVQKMKAELPYYVHFLLTRQLKYETPVGVFWLPQSVIKTNGYTKIVQDNKVTEQTSVEDYLINWFYRNGNKSEVWFTCKDLIGLVDCDGKPPSSKWLSMMMRDKMHMSTVPDTNTRYKQEMTYITVDPPATGKYWCAQRDAFVTQGDVFSDVRV